MIDVTDARRLQAVARDFGVTLSEPDPDVDPVVSAADALAAAREPIVPTTKWLCVMTRDGMPDERRLVWWFVQDGVESWSSGPMPLPGAPPRRKSMYKGQAAAAIDAVTGEQLLSGVWGRSM